jgi:peptidyl-prolyl cis-trans isomerase SurA
MNIKTFFRHGWLALLLLVPLILNAEEIDRIVALVEEDVILKSELDQAISLVEAQANMRGERLPPRNVMEEQMLERLIMTRLEIQRAEETGIRVSDSDIDQALERVARQNQLTMGQLRSALEADGIDFREFRDEVREELLTTRLRQRVAQSMDEITETEIDILLASDSFGGNEYLLSQIMIGVPEGTASSEAERLRARAEDIVEQIRDGLEFSTAALTYSQAPDAMDGGDVGWRNLNAMPPLFAEAIAEAEPGQVLDPIRTPSGYVILHVRDVRDQSEVIVREYRARHLMVTPTELITPQQARDRIFELHQRIKDGEDFGELARRYSADESSANIGGRLNWFRAGEYGTGIQSAVEVLEPGEMAEPFESTSGWHIVRLEEVRDADRTTEALRAEAREMLFQQKAEEEVERFLRRMRDESFVEIRL